MAGLRRRCFIGTEMVPWSEIGQYCTGADAFACHPLCLSGTYDISVMGNARSPLTCLCLGRDGAVWLPGSGCSEGPAQQATVAKTH